MKNVIRLPLDRDDEPAVCNPELARLVELARRQGAPRLTTGIEQIRAGWSERRARRRRALGLCAAAGLVALVCASLYRGIESTSGHDDAVAADQQRSDEDTIALATGPTDADAARDGGEPSERLATGVRVEARSEDAAYHVAGPWTVEVAAGVYEVSAPVEAISRLHVRVGGRTLVVEPGGSVRVEAGEHADASLLVGQAAWVERDGRRVDLQGPLDDLAATRRADAAALARKAERLMAAGDRPGAISAYRTLVRKYPRSASTRAGLLDLARLLKSAGDIDGARCAYTLYLERWPTNHLRPEIERALQRLGPGPKCREL